MMPMLPHFEKCRSSLLQSFAPSFNTLKERVHMIGCRKWSSAYLTIQIFPASRLNQFLNLLSIFMWHIPPCPPPSNTFIFCVNLNFSKARSKLSLSEVMQRGKERKVLAQGMLKTDCCLMRHNHSAVPSSTDYPLSAIAYESLSMYQDANRLASLLSKFCKIFPRVPHKMQNKS